MRRAFSLIEITLTIGILSLLLSITIAISHNAIGRSGLRTAESIIVQGVRRAQTLSQNNIAGSQYGIHVQTGAAIIFSGSSFTLRSTADDLTMSINDQITLGGTLYEKMIKPPIAGLTFTRFTGEPTPANYSGTIILGLDGETRTIQVNGKGIVQR